MNVMKNILTVSVAKLVWLWSIFCSFLTLLIREGEMCANTDSVGVSECSIPCKAWALLMMMSLSVTTGLCKVLSLMGTLVDRIYASSTDMVSDQKVIFKHFPPAQRLLSWIQALAIGWGRIRTCPFLIVSRNLIDRAISFFVYKGRSHAISCVLTVMTLGFVAWISMPTTQSEENVVAQSSLPTISYSGHDIIRTYNWRWFFWPFQGAWEETFVEVGVHYFNQNKLCTLYEVQSNPFYVGEPGYPDLIRKGTDHFESEHIDILYTVMDEGESEDRLPSYVNDFVPLVGLRGKETAAGRYTHISWGTKKVYSHWTNINLKANHDNGRKLYEVKLRLENFIGEFQKFETFRVFLNPGETHTRQVIPAGPGGYSVIASESVREVPQSE